MAAEPAADDRPLLLGSAARLLLGSASPRRRDLLGVLGVPFDSATADIDERALVTSDAHATVARIARAKFDALSERAEHRNRIILTADTMVASGGQVLGKPIDEVDARSMLRSMSGGSVEISTAVCLGEAGREPAERLVTTTVQLIDLIDEQIEDYLATGAALDKAGALELQGAAASFIATVDGCWSNVVGLPICAVAQLLANESGDGSQRCSGRACGVGRG